MNNDSIVQFGREYFERYYAGYDRQNPPKKLHFYRNVVESATVAIRNPRILDLGCAFGRFLSVLDSNWERFGNDLSDYAIEYARNSVAGIKFAVSSITRIPFEETFDVVTAFDVIEHYPQLDEVVLTVQSKLTPDGSFIFVVPVYDGPTGAIVRLLDKDITHVHKESRNFWLNWANENFILEDWWGIYRYLFPIGYYMHFPTKAFRRFAPAIAVVTRRRK